MFWKIFWMFFKIGATCFGGGYGMMSMMFDEGNRLLGLTASEFADMTALDLICPGTIALNSATYIGYLKGGFPGAIAGTLGLITPTVIVCTAVICFLKKFNESKIVKGLFRGITPACAGLLIYTSITLFTGVFFNSESIRDLHAIEFSGSTIAALVLFLSALVLEFRYKVDPIILTVLGAVVGLIFLR